MLKRCAITLVLAMFSLCAYSFAQDNPPGGQEPKAANGPERRGGMSPADQTQRLTKELNLSSDQQTKVQSILEDQQKQMQALRQDTSSTSEDRRSKMMDIHKNTVSQVRAVLNDDQQKKFDEMQAKREQEMGAHQKGQEQPK